MGRELAPPGSPALRPTLITSMAEGAHKDTTKAEPTHLAHRGIRIVGRAMGNRKRIYGILIAGSVHCDVT